MAKKKMYDVRPPRKKPFLAVKKARLKAGRVSWPAVNVKVSGVVLVLLLLGGGIFLMHRSAQVVFTLTPGRRTVQATGRAQARADIMKPAEGLLRAQSVSREKEVSGKFEATGLSETASKAAGTVKVFNNYHLQQILVQDTRFLSADGQLFYSTRAVSIPPGGSLEVPVTAAEPGPDYNIGPTTFSIPGLLGSARYTSVYAESESAMKGGDRGKVSKVTEADLARAERELIKKAESELTQVLEEAVGSPFKLISGAVKVEVLDASASAEIGEEVEKFGYFLQVRGDGLAYHEDDAQTIIKKELKNELQGEERLDNDSLRTSVHSQSFDVVKGEALVEVSGTVEVVRSISRADIKRETAGRSLKEVEVSLASTSMVKEAEVEVSPFWIRTVPEDEDRIEVRIED